MSNLTLAQILPGHRSDVKCLASTAKGMVSVGRGGQLISWYRSGAHSLSAKGTTDAGSGSAANSVAVFAAKSGPDYILVGLSSGIIACFCAASGDQVAKLVAHKSNVCVMQVDQHEKQLISGSWDGTAVVWNLSELYERTGTHCENFVLRGHEQSVWAVKFCPGERDCFFTGSADKTIRKWNKNKTSKSFKVNDIVRAIEIVDSNRVMVLYNTGSISLWDLDGNSLAVYTGLSGEFMYSMKMFSAGSQKRLIACGEGGNVDVWDVSENVQLTPGQSFKIPAASLWSAAVLANGDVAIGASDSNIYLFTYDMQHQTDEKIKEQFQNALTVKEQEERVLKQKEASQDVVTIKVALGEGAPSLDLKYRKGTDPALAAQEFILENDLPQHFLHEIIEFIKSSVPEANNPTGPASKRQKQSVNICGEVYDFALDVSLGAGNDVKIGYNAGEDYEMAALRFCNQNNVPKAMAPKLSAMLRSQFPDVGPSSSDMGDPLTGANRYIPDGQGSSAEVTDPLKPRTSEYPLASPTFFLKAPVRVDKAIEKLLEYNNLQEENVKLNDSEMAAFQCIFSDDVTYSFANLASGLQKGFSWPLNTLLPIVDVFRLSVSLEDVNMHFFGPQRVQESLSKLRAILLTSEETSVTLTVCRALCNIFKHPQGCEAMKTDINNWLQIFISMVIKFPKAQVAVSKVIGNIAFFLGMSTGQIVDIGPREDALIGIILALKHAIEENPMSFRLDREAAVHLLISLVTLLWGDKELVKMAKNNGIADIVSHLQDSIPDEDGKMVAREITVMIHSV